MFRNQGIRLRTRQQEYARRRSSAVASGARQRWLRHSLIRAGRDLHNNLTPEPPRVDLKPPLRHLKLGVAATIGVWADSMGIEGAWTREISITDSAQTDSSAGV